MHSIVHVAPIRSQILCYFATYGNNPDKGSQITPWAAADVPRQINKSLWAKCLKVKLDFLTTDIFCNSK